MDSFKEIEGRIQPTCSIKAMSVSAVGLLRHRSCWATGGDSDPPG